MRINRKRYKDMLRNTYLLVSACVFHHICSQSVTFAQQISIREQLEEQWVWTRDYSSCNRRLAAMDETGDKSGNLRKASAKSPAKIRRTAAAPAPAPFVGLFQLDDNQFINCQWASASNSNLKISKRRCTTRSTIDGTPIYKVCPLECRSWYNQIPSINKVDNVETSPGPAPAPIVGLFKLDDNQSVNCEWASTSQSNLKISKRRCTTRSTKDGSPIYKVCPVECTENTENDSDSTGFSTKDEMDKIPAAAGPAPSPIVGLFQLDDNQFINCEWASTSQSNLKISKRRCTTRSTINGVPIYKVCPVECALWQSQPESINIGVGDSDDIDDGNKGNNGVGDSDDIDLYDSNDIDFSLGDNDEENNGSLTRICKPSRIQVNRASGDNKICPTKGSPFGTRNKMTSVRGDIISEASGLVSSRVNPGIIWTHNDYG